MGICKRPLDVLLAFDGPHAMGHLADCRFRALEALDPGAPVDVILFPAGKVGQFLTLLEEARAWPAHVWAGPRSGSGRIVFDASGEASPMSKPLAKTMHRFLAAIGVPFDRAVYLTAEPPFAEAYRAYCDLLGLSRTMKVLHYDLWVRKFLLDYDQAGEEVFEQRLAVYRARPRRRDRRFLSLNLTPRPCKLVFLLNLLKDGLWDQGFISFGGFERRLHKDPMERVEARLRACPGLETLAAEVAPHLPELRAMGETVFRTKGRYIRPGKFVKHLEDAALAEYNGSWFSVVTETEMRPALSRITEKPLKPLANFHPFLLLGNPGAVGLLRKLGFESFAEVFDESYDDELDPLNRYRIVYDEVRRLCALDEAELDRFDAELSEVVVFNARRALVELPRRYRDKIDPELLAEILAP
jgi:hypothetical protein